MTTFGPLVYFLRRYPGRFSAVLAVAAIAAGAETVALASFYPLITLVLGGSLTGGGSILAPIAELIGSFPPVDRTRVALTLFLAAVAANGAAKLLREWVIAHVSTYVTFDVKRSLFARTLGAPYLHLASLRPGEVTYRLTSAPPYLAMTLVVTSQLAGLALSAAALTALLATIEPRLTGVVIVVGAGFYVLNRYGLLGALAEAGRRRVAAALAEAGIVTELIAGAREISVAGVGPVWLRRYAREADAHRRGLRRDFVLSMLPGLTMETTVLVALGIIAVALRVAVPEVLTSALPMVAVYGLAVRQLLNVLSQASRTWLRLAGMSSELSVLRDALTEPLPSVRHGTAPVPSAWHRIRLEGVTVRYPGRDDPALAAVDIEIPRGATVALVGPSGSGKTTVLGLLLRLFDPSAGRIRVNDEDLGDLDPAAWTGAIGYVAQDGAILDATVRENVAFGRTLDPGAVEAAATAAHAVEFIERLPLGYETRLGDRGRTLSVGQRQRLLVARALAHRPALLLLDEATSALDSRSEQLIHAALDRLRGERTVIIVGHRLSTVRDADTIVVLDRGHVVETGDHDALMRRGGTYAQLARLQGATEPAPS